MRNLIVTITTPEGEEIAWDEIEVGHETPRIFIMDMDKVVGELNIYNLGITEL